MAIDIGRADGVATVTINRPEAFNAFNTGQLHELLTVLRGLRDDRSTGCVILTGAGDRAFAAGADIKEMVGLSSDEATVFGRLGHQVTAAIEGLPQPVIAAVNGYAFGGGCELALACDIRLAADNAVFAQPEVSLGIPPGWGGTQRLARIVGLGRAAELVLTGRRCKADEALKIGLVTAVYPHGQLLPEARALAGHLLQNSPQAMAKAKQALGLALNGNPAAGLATELTLFAESFGTADQLEGMTAFIEKRRAVYRRG